MVCGARCCLILNSSVASVSDVSVFFADWEKTAHLILNLCKSVFNLQQQNFKQKVVALLKRFKVSDEVSNSFCKPFLPCVLPSA